MKKAFWLLALIGVVGCGGNQPGANSLSNSGTFNKPGTGTNANNPAASALLKGTPARIVAAGNEVGFKLFTDSAKSAEDSFVMSPLGFASLVTLASNALEAEGQGAFAKALKLEGIKPQDVNNVIKQLRDALPSADTSAEFRNGNSIWVSSEAKLDKDFTSTNRKYFGAKAGTIDDKALKAINAWASDASGGRVKDIVNQKDLEASGVFLNASGFAATLPFTTSTEEFKPAKGDAVKTSFLSASAGMDYAKVGTLEAVRIPIQNGRMLLYVLVPDASEGVKSVFPLLNATGWAKIDGGFATKTVNVSLPALKVGTEHNLNSVLEALAIPTTFKKISSKPVLVKQKSFIEIAGSSTETTSTTPAEGAAATLKADHPFVYVVEDAATKSILLVGLYAKP